MRGASSLRGFISEGMHACMMCCEMNCYLYLRTVLLKYGAVLWIYRLSHSLFRVQTRVLYELTRLKIRIYISISRSGSVSYIHSRTQYVCIHTYMQDRMCYVGPALNHTVKVYGTTNISAFQVRSVRCEV